MRTSFCLRPRSWVRCLSVSLCLLSMLLEMHGFATATETAPATQTAIVPGPLRSFLRLAGVSQKIGPEQVLPLLARNVYMQGYSGVRGREHPTEFLILLTRYVRQARELSILAGDEHVIRASNCEQSAPLLRVLGYRTREACGQPDTSLITSDPERAFLTIDSGFPLNDLEEALQGGKPFAYSFEDSRVPVLFTENEWSESSEENGRGPVGIIDNILRNPQVARLYWALSRTDVETRNSLVKSPGLKRLMPVASVFDFYGSRISIRSGRVAVPGGRNAEAQWKAVVGASPDFPDEFVPRLMARDRGWTAAYFDALARANQDQQMHLTEGTRLRRFYEAFHKADPSEDASRPSFRPASSLLLLLTRLQWEPTGQPHVPGDLSTWAQVLRQKADSRASRDWARRSERWQSPDQLLEALFALSRENTAAGPLQAYLALSEIDSNRPANRQLSPQTVLFLANKFVDYGDQYRIFSDFPELDDASIMRFMNVAQTLGSLPNHELRGNAMGVFQANLGLWEILARQDQIPRDKRNASFQRTLRPFASLSSSAQLFEAGTSSLADILRAAGGSENISQDGIIGLLAGPPQTTRDGQRMHAEVANRIRAVLDDQRLVSLDTLLPLGRGLSSIEHGQAADDSLTTLAGELREFEMPRPIFSNSERTEWAAGLYNNHHTDLEMRTDVAKIIKAPGSRTRLEEARGQLSPFLRDTLVGLNYAYYEPPGAQILHNNPLFVRSHDFDGDTVSGVEHLWQAARLFGEGSPAGGGVRLVGSLADLPYILARVEQDFISPENVQALIWQDLVPGLLISSTLPRWWSVSRNELHAVALYQRTGEELLTAAAGNPALRQSVLGILSQRMTPLEEDKVESGLRSGDLSQLVRQLMPADTFYLAVELRRKDPEAVSASSTAGQELNSLCNRYPSELSWERLSQDFGIPHPVLAQRYSSELLNMQPLPALSGYSSRLLAETWDSSNLYWARLADEKGYAPVTLNRLAPELTRRMIEKIFATDLEDWPAILRAMRETGEEFQQGKVAARSPDGFTNRP